MGTTIMSAEELSKLTALTPEQADNKRFREIGALQDAGVATWDEIKEKIQITRRRVLRGVNKE
jgi:hypothetical protein